MKRTFQPKKLKRIRKFGYRERSKSAAGMKVLLRRRRRGRKSLSATENYKLYRKKPNNAVR